VGSGNNDVGNATPTRNSNRPAAQKAEPRIDSPTMPERQARRPNGPAGVCGAMSQQGGAYRGDFSAPQKFVHLVGCHDGKIGRRPKARQLAEPVKR
jgi:hypothetical protein